MGTQCSKSTRAQAEGKQENSLTLRPSPGRAIGIVQQASDIQLESSLYASDVHPPHSVLKQSINDLAKTHRFYISIYGIKARNVKLRGSRATASTFCVINWDDFSYERRTKVVQLGPNPKWTETLQFYYSVSSLDVLSTRYVTLQIYQELYKRTRSIGLVKLDLFSIASGPIHHDLALRTASYGLGNRGESDVGRLVFDIRMAQVCQLIISPVEILVHLHKTLTDLDQLEVEGIGTKRPSLLENTGTETVGTSQTELFSNPVSASSITSSVAPSGLTLKKSPVPHPGVKEDVFGALASSPYEDASVSNGLSSPESPTSRDNTHSQSMNGLSSASALVACDSLPKARDKDDEMEGTLERAARGGHSESDARDPFLAEWQLTFTPTGVDNPFEYCSAWTSMCAQPYWNSVDHSVVHQMTTFADTNGVPWDVLAISRIGTSNPESKKTDAGGRCLSHIRRASSESVVSCRIQETSKGDQKSRGPLSLASKLLTSLPKTGTLSRRPSRDSSQSVTSASSGHAGFQGHTMSTPLPRSSAESSIVTNYLVTPESVSNVTDDNCSRPSVPSSVPSAQLRHIPLSIVADLKPAAPKSSSSFLDQLHVRPRRGTGSKPVSHLEKKDTCNSSSLLLPYSSSLVSSNGSNASVKEASHDVHGEHSYDLISSRSMPSSSISEVSGMKHSSNHLTPFSSASSSPAPLQSTVQYHLNHLDPQATYEKLAAMCRSGKLVREMLYDDLPSIQLETTSDFLRQNHLKLRLYSKRSGFNAPEFYGEAWLPFFKIYDADIVEQMHKNFSDAYFHEKLWFEGKCIGHIEGVIVFQNNPIVRQMVAGVHTDQGFMRISPPILGTKQKSVRFTFRGQDSLPEEVQKLSLLHQSLLDILYTKTQHMATEAGLVALHKRASMHPGTTGLEKRGPFSFLHLDATALMKRKPKVGPPGSALNASHTLKHFNYLSTAGTGGSPAGTVSMNDMACAQQEFHETCDQILSLLRMSHVETRRSFLYKSSEALLTGQHIFLDLACHILEFGEYVPWQYRSTYMAILHHILRRGELDLGTCLPEAPKCITELGLPPDEVYLLHSEIKKSKKRRHLPPSQKTLESGSLGHTSGPLNQLSLTPFKHRSWMGIALASRTDFDRHSVAVPANTACVKSEQRVEQALASMSNEVEIEIEFFHRRMKLCKLYYLILNRVLNSCLTQFSSDCVFEGHRKYLSIFLCIIYFRLPAFRKTLLEFLLNDEERHANVPEWRGTEFELDALSLKRLNEWQPGCEYRLMLDWEPLCETLVGYFGTEALEAPLQHWPQPPDTWREAFEKKGPSFFSFLENWAKHVYHVVPQKQGLRWHTLPGYPSLLKALLLQMKLRDVTRYPDALLNCSGALLANERLLSVFIKILFLKTSVHNTAAVFAALNYVDYWIQVLSLRDQPLPPNFDLSFLRRGLDIVLGSDIGLCVAKGLWFIYKNLPIFKESQLRVFLIDLLMNKYFFTLFLNWSWLVRRCFMWLLLYRICEATRLVLSESSWEKERTEKSQSNSKLEQGQQQTGCVAAIMTGLPRICSTIAEKKIVLWAYLEFSRYLVVIGGPTIFPTQPTLEAVSAFMLISEGPFMKPNDDRKGTMVPSLLEPLPQNATSSSKTTNVMFNQILSDQESETLHFSSDQGSSETLAKAKKEPPTAIRPRIIIKRDNEQEVPQVPFNISGGVARPRHGTPSSVLTAQTEATKNAGGHTRREPHTDGIQDRIRYLVHFLKMASDSTKKGGDRTKLEDEKRHLPSSHVKQPYNSDYWSPGSPSSTTSPKTTTVAPSSLITSSAEIPESLRVYLKSAIPELVTELELYQNWVASGAPAIPPMNIPASPLDNNVDVPIEQW